ncbi:hypothetical protein P7C70_g6337, partial [Phenoliferia sp. Uapishka_3]
MQFSLVARRNATRRRTTPPSAPPSPWVRVRVRKPPKNTLPSTPLNQQLPNLSLLSTARPSTSSTPPVGLSNVQEETVSESKATDSVVPPDLTSLTNSWADDSDLESLHSFASIVSESSKSDSSDSESDSPFTMSDPTFAHLASVGILSPENAKAWFTAAEIQCQISKIEGIRTGSIESPEAPASPLYHPVRAVPVLADPSTPELISAHDSLLTT